MKTFDTCLKKIKIHIQILENSELAKVCKKEEIKRKRTNGCYGKNIEVGKIQTFLINSTRPIKISVTVVRSLEIILLKTAFLQKTVTFSNCT